MKRMTRLTYILAALAMVMMTTIPAQAEFKGTLQRDQDWLLEINNESPDSTTATVYYLGKNLEVIEILTVSAAETIQQTIPKPGRGVRRAIVEVDPTFNPNLQNHFTFRVVQGVNSFLSDCTSTREGDTFRFVFDVV